MDGSESNEGIKTTSRVEQMSSESIRESIWLTKFLTAKFGCDRRFRCATPWDWSCKEKSWSISGPLTAAIENLVTFVRTIRIQYWEISLLSDLKDSLWERSRLSSWFSRAWGQEPDSRLSQDKIIWTVKRQRFFFFFLWLNSVTRFREKLTEHEKQLSMPSSFAISTSQLWSGSDTTFLPSSSWPQSALCGVQTPMCRFFYGSKWDSQPDPKAIRHFGFCSHLSLKIEVLCRNFHKLPQRVWNFR
jgi:hypothetical protein